MTMLIYYFKSTAKNNFIKNTITNKYGLYKVTMLC